MHSLADVITDELPQFHQEVKRCEALSIFKALQQAIDECKGLIPIVAHKRNSTEWCVVMRADDWLKIVVEYNQMKDLKVTIEPILQTSDTSHEILS